MPTSKIVWLANEEQGDRILSLLEQLKYGLQEPFFLVQLKRLTHHSRIRTRDEAAAAIRILEGILARRSGEAVTEEPRTDRGGRAA